MATRLCLRCRRRTKGSYCPRCKRIREAEKLKRAPWLRLYDLPEWKAAKWSVHRRDGYRCMYLDARGRCTQTARTTTLEAHHVVKVRELWLRARGNWRVFLEAALDESQIITLCYRHHLKADQPGRRTKTAASARPLPRRN